VVVPRANVKHLMLRPDVVAAAREGRFRVFAAETVDEALELMTGVPAGVRGPDGAFPPDSVNGRVEARLVEMSQRRLALAREAGRRDGEAGGAS
jgi:predicted ATP-dependent protease